jgi:triosephosphate isomerase
MKTPIVAGNWKMHKTPLEGQSFVGEVKNRLLDKEEVKVIFCPPFTSLFSMVDILKNTPFGLGAQNVHWEPTGAFTGEISVDMLKACSVNYVIVGHSERRHVFGEPDDWINKKVHAVLRGSMIPLFCIGETLDERKTGQTTAVLASQLRKGLKDVSPEQMESVVVAYEPVWAIGTGENASVQQVQEAHQSIRTILKTLYSAELSQKIPVLYGGSVKPGNTLELIQADGVDGFLIGGASLKVDSFCEIIQTVGKHYLRK